MSPQVGQVDSAKFDELMEESPDEALELLAGMSRATDRELAALSRRLAGRIVLDLARTGKAKSRGVGRLVRAPADENSGDIDFDASMDALVTARSERRPPAVDELRATRWTRPDTAICLLVDRSGSMNGERLACAALAAAVCAWRAPAQFAVLAFSDRVVSLKDLTATKSPETVVADVLSLQGHGTTDLALALAAARQQLAGSSATRRLTVLLSDAQVTTGSDPIPWARGLDELVVIAPAEDPDDARALVAAAGGRLAEVCGPMSVLSALRTVVG